MLYFALNAGLLFTWLIRYKIYKLQPGWKIFLLRIAIANTVLACCVVYLTPSMQNWLSWGRQDKALYLLSIILSGVIMYGLSLVLTGLRNGHEITSRFHASCITA